MADTLLQITDLQTHFATEEGLVKAVEGISLTIERGETLGLVGESGCGKSVTAMSILQLNPVPPTIYAGGQIVFDGRDLLHLPEPQLRKVRGNDIAMIFQEPMTSLNPVYTVGSPDRRGVASAQADDPPRRGAPPSSCSTRSASPRPISASTSTRTSCRAA